jgi:D,D-heptose 1,7-bisphosphate phosphatase
MPSNRNRRQRRAVFLDKDGTLIHDVPYNVDPALIRFLPGTRQAVQCLHESGFELVVITNQSGVARGFFAEADLAPVENCLRRHFAAWGARLAGFFYCPHHPEGTVAAYSTGCACRKPEPGLLFSAAAELNIDLGQSWVVGDILHDVEAGRRAGCRTVLVDTGGETEWVLGPRRLPHYIIGNLADAAQLITALAGPGQIIWRATPEAICAG